MRRINDQQVEFTDLELAIESYVLEDSGGREFMDLMDAAAASAGATREDLDPEFIDYMRIYR